MFVLGGVRISCVMYGNNAMKRSKEAAKNRLKAEFIGSDEVSIEQKHAITITDFL